MKKKIFYLALISLLLCGCSIDYDLKINQDLTVDEKAIIYDDSSAFSEFKTVDDALNSYINEYSARLNNLNYKYSKYYKNNIAGLKITNSYGSLNDYVNTTSGFYKYFNSIDYVKNNNISLLRYNSLLFLYDQNPNLDVADENNITITIPYKIISITNLNCNYSNNVNVCTFKINKNVEPGTSYEIVFDNSILASENDKPILKDKITDDITNINNDENKINNDVIVQDTKEKMPFKLILMIILLVLLVGFMISLIFIYKFKKNNNV